MKRLIWVLSIVMSCGAGSSAQERSIPKLNDPLEGKISVSETGVEDQTDVAVTVYNNNLALVRDRRLIKLLPGEISLTFMDVAQQIMPETVSIKSLSNPGSLSILEQNYEYDLMSPSKMMEKYVGKTVRLLNFHNDIGFSEVEAELLSINQGPVYKIDGEIYLGHPGTVVLPQIPENLIAKPSLVWLLDNEGTDQEVEVTYLTHGISWKADYVLKLERSDTQMDIAAWVTLHNQSGAPYVNAQLKLVAGSLNRAAPPMPEFRAMAMKSALSAPMREESFAEYHLYTLPRRTTIKQNQSKQVSMFTATAVGVKKIYEFRGNVSFYSQQRANFGKQNVDVFLAFENKEENGLGIPFPAGIMRIYQEDSEGMLQFAGEDRIPHTPKDEEMRLRMGSAFDIIGERTQTDFTKIATRVIESSYEIKIRNHKATPIVVDVIEPMPADWTIIRESQAHIEKDAHTAIFQLAVEPDEEKILTYRVRVRY